LSGRRRGLLSRLFGRGGDVETPARDQPATDVELRPAWQRGDGAIEGDAIAFWRRLGILPPGVAPEERADQLVAAAYRRGELVGVTTAVPDRIESLRAQFFMLRAAVDPGHRRTHAAIALIVYSRDLLEKWAADNPEEKIAGIGAVIENEDVAARLAEPYWPVTRLGLVGHMPNWRQIRVAWFGHFKYD
jgi:hypothetical protein